MEEYRSFGHHSCLSVGIVQCCSVRLDTSTGKRGLRYWLGTVYTLRTE